MRLRNEAGLHPSEGGTQVLIRHTLVRGQSATFQGGALRTKSHVLEPDVLQREHPLGPHELGRVDQRSGVCGELESGA